MFLTTSPHRYCNLNSDIGSSFIILVLLGPSFFTLILNKVVSPFELTPLYPYMNRFYLNWFISTSSCQLLKCLLRKVGSYFLEIILKSHSIASVSSTSRNYHLRSLRKNCPFSELFWFVFSRIRTEYRELLHISPYSVQMRENANQNISEYGRFSRSDNWKNTSLMLLISFLDFLIVNGKM